MPTLLCEEPVDFLTHGQMVQRFQCGIRTVNTIMVARVFSYTVIRIAILIINFAKKYKN